MARRRPPHDRRPADGHGAEIPPPHRHGRRVPQPRRVREARRNPARVPTGPVRPARHLPRARTSNRGRSSMSYVDGFIVPLPNGKEEEYRQTAQMFARKAREQGAIGSVEAIGDDLQHGKTTDFFMAVKAEQNENVVFSFIIWPDKQTRDQAWQKLMADPEMQPGA